MLAGDRPFLGRQLRFLLSCGRGLATHSWAPIQLRLTSAEYQDTVSRKAPHSTGFGRRPSILTKRHGVFCQSKTAQRGQNPTSQPLRHASKSYLCLAVSRLHTATPQKPNFFGASFTPPSYLAHKMHFGRVEEERRQPRHRVGERPLLNCAGIPACGALPRVCRPRWQRAHAAWSESQYWLVLGRQIQLDGRLCGNALC